jgi:hypothetical protein
MDFRSNDAETVTAFVKTSERVTSAGFDNLRQI